MELVINLKTAKTLALTIPLPLLGRTTPGTKPKWSSIRFCTAVGGQADTTRAY